MEFDFPLLPLLPTPITVIPASTFAELERQPGVGQSTLGACSAFTSNVMIGSCSSSSSLYSSTPPLSSSSSSSSGHHLGSLNGYAGTSLGGGSTSTAQSDLEKLGRIVDALGEASAKAQDLPSSITQRLRLAKNPSHRIYIVRSGVASEISDLASLSTAGYPGDSNSPLPHLQDITVMRQQHQQPQQPKKRDEGGGKVDSESLEDDSTAAVVTGMLKMGEKKLFIVDRFGVMHEQEACCVLDFYVNEACQRQGYGKQLFDYMLKTEEIAPEQIAYDRPSPKLYRFLKKHFGLEHHVPQPNQFAIFEGFMLADTGEPLQASGGGSSISTSHTEWPAMGRRSSPSSMSSNSSLGMTHDTGLPSTSGASSLSSSFSSGIMAQPYATMGQRPLSFHQQQQQQQPSCQQSSQPALQQPNRRISSAFTSSIQLGDVSDKNSAMSAQQPSRRISSAYTSSIDLSHPSALSTLP